jgi:hypothetical protein
MPAPILTPEEIAQLQIEAARQQNFADSLAAAVPAKTARAAELAVADGAFKKFFDYYNDDIIGQYDAEKEALNGIFIIDPITEADIEGPANIDGSVRTTPSLPVTDIIRVPEFDGGGTSTTLINETQHIADQAIIEDQLVNGFPSSGGFNPASAVTDSVLNSASTDLSILDPTDPLTIVVGDFLYITDGVNFAILEITSVTNNMGGDPPYSFTYGIDFVYAPAGPITSGVAVRDYTGFSDAQRNTKTAPAGYQILMNALIDYLETAIESRIDRLDEQLVALSANEDPDGIAQILTATTNVNTSKTFLTLYLITTDISDVGLLTLSTERGVRSPEIIARVAEINTNYTGQTENYYDRRYGIANDRGNTARGSLRLQVATEQSIGTLVDYADQAQDAVDAINALLP